MEAIIIGCLIIWCTVLTILVGALFIELHCINKVAENELKKQVHFTICSPDLDQTSLSNHSEQKDEMCIYESTVLGDESYQTLL